METKSWTTIDKSKWAAGQWHDEPDKVQWLDKATGRPCLAVRNDMGAWCGYVGVPFGHPLFGKEYSEIDDIEVHWGLTFAGECRVDANEARDICHVPAPGESDRVWWLGFDCAHCDDFSPGLQSTLRGAGSDFELGGTYRNLSYVKAECEHLAAQLEARA